MNYKHYETVFILTPVLSTKQVEESVTKFRNLITSMNCQIIHEEDLGIKRLAYPVKTKTTGIYKLFEFTGDPSTISKLEIEYTRDEKILRFLTIALDKHGIQYNKNKREGVKEKSVEKEA